MTDIKDYSLLQYDYELPKELIAHEPISRRDHSRLMLVERKNRHRQNLFFYDLIKCLREDDLLVLNNTRVIPARMIGKREDTGGVVELLLIKKTGDNEYVWETMIKPGKRARPGIKLVFDGGVKANIEDICDNGHRIVSFEEKYTMQEIMSLAGKVPLPPYIKKEIENSERYQTVYSKAAGSVAAPTAGFHFTDEIFSSMKEKGIKKIHITLHIGPGTFRPVKNADIRFHNMHSEYYEVSGEAAETINCYKKNGKRIIAVGTTSCRVLESLADENGLVSCGSGWTDIFIYPGFKFRVIDGLLTNFHLPRSTLFMLVSAFAGTAFMKESYREAINNLYRFYSFGDCMLIL